MMNMASGGAGDAKDGAEDVALSDLQEVEACLREMLQTTQDPTVLQRLYNLHREIQKYIAEVLKK